MGYDPKRPRPSVASESQVDALIEPVVPVVEPLAVVPSVPEQVAEVQVEAPDGGQGTGDRPAVPSTDRQPTPVVPAPAEGTANRAVVAAVVAAVAALMALVVLLRRRRQG